MWPVSLDFLLALFQIQMEYVDTGRLSCGRLLGLSNLKESFTHRIGRWRKALGRSSEGKTAAGCKKTGRWVLAVFMNGPIMSHQELGGHENTKGDKRYKKLMSLSCAGGEQRRRCAEIGLSEGRPVSLLRDRGCRRRRGNRCGACQRLCKLD